MSSLLLIIFSFSFFWKQTYKLFFSIKKINEYFIMNQKKIASPPKKPRILMRSASRSSSKENSMVLQTPKTSQFLYKPPQNSIILKQNNEFLNKNSWFWWQSPFICGKHWGCITKFLGQCLDFKRNSSKKWENVEDCCWDFAKTPEFQQKIRGFL